MNAKTLSNGLLRTIGILTAIMILLWFLNQITAIIVYIIIAAVLTLISRPLIRFLKTKLKFKNTLAVFATIGVYTFLVISIVGLFTPLISKQSDNLSLLNSDEFKGNIQILTLKANVYLLEHNIDILEKIKTIDFLPGLKNIPNTLNIILSKIGSFSIGLLSVLFITFFLMLDAKLLSKSTFAFVPKQSRFKVARSLESIKDLLSRYFIGLVIQITVLFVIYAATLTFFQIENAIIIAFICAMFNLIPFLGPAIGGLLMFVFATTNNLSLDFQTEIIPNSLYIMGGYLFAQLIDNFISQPLIFSKSVKSHPLEIFLVILIFGNLFGVIGMVISIPAYTAIKVILKEFYSDNKVVELLTKDI
ncbi:AI-2E family transporter [Flavobacteriaceae bacterium]|nr:AI-2E family transporter [Flavobacteriaceae bacterium]